MANVGRAFGGFFVLALVAVACGDSESNGHDATGGGGTAGSARGGSAGTVTGGAGAGGRGASGNAGATNGGTAGNSGTGGRTGGSGGRTAGSGGDAGVSGTGAGGESMGGEGGGGGENGAGEGGGGGSDVACTDAVTMPPATSCGIFGTVVSEYRVGEATEERLTFDIRLRARELISVPDPVPVNQIEVHYYFSQEETSGWQARVDSFVQRAPDLDLGATASISIGELNPRQLSFQGCQTHFIRIRNDSTHALVPASNAGEPYLEFRVTLEPTSSAPPNQSHTNDYSYDASATAFRQNLGIGVYVCGQLVAGCTPGEISTCP
jgi:hypothetical protein